MSIGLEIYSLTPSRYGNAIQVDCRDEVESLAQVNKNGVVSVERVCYENTKMERERDL
jgi:hypothetical protein